MVVGVMANPTDPSYLFIFFFIFFQETRQTRIWKETLQIGINLVLDTDKPKRQRRVVWWKLYFPV